MMSDFKAKKAPNSMSADPQLTPSPLSVLRASKQFASPNMYP